MEIKTIGTGRRLIECARTLSSYDAAALGSHASPLGALGCAVPRYESLLIMPVPTSRNGKYITGTELGFAEAAALADGETLAVGYGIPDLLAELLGARGAAIYDLELDEKFLEENAKITANGALADILSSHPKDISELKVGVVGFGRIGSRLCSLLLFLGARLKVYTTRESVCHELCSSGVDSELLSEGTDFSSLDLLVNTAPARIMSEEKFAALPMELKILDLASGKIFPDSERVKKLSSVPEVMYPVTAGGIMAAFISRKLYGASGEVIL